MDGPNCARLPHQTFGILAAPGCGPFRFRSLDHNPDPEVLRLLATRTATPAARVVRTTINVFASLDLLREHPHKNVIAFCPLCLGGKVAYYRRGWCVKFVLSCVHHGCTLLDTCPGCGALIRFEQVPLEMESLAMCRTCGFDLRLSPISSAMSTHTTALQQRLLRLLS